MLVIVTALIAGALFGAGLTVSQMISPEKVLAFLDVAGNWDPSLALVMGGALVVSAIGYGIAKRRSRPIISSGFQIPSRRDIDWRLLSGATIFGIGWGLAGYCPGPAIAAVAIGTSEPWYFLLAMLAGSIAARPLMQNQ